MRFKNLLQRKVGTKRGIVVFRSKYEICILRNGLKMKKVWIVNNNNRTWRVINVNKLQGFCKPPEVWPYYIH